MNPLGSILGGASKSKGDKALLHDTNTRKDLESQLDKPHEDTDKPMGGQLQKKIASLNAGQRVGEENTKSAEDTTNSKTAASSVNLEQEKAKDSKTGTPRPEKDNSNPSKESATGSQSSDPSKESTTNSQSPDSSKGGATGSQSSKPEIKSKRLILCFDGTGNKFGTVRTRLEMYFTDPDF